MITTCPRYDHSLLETEEEGCEARRLTQRACHSTLTLGEQQRLLAELDRAGDTGVQVTILIIHWSRHYDHFIICLVQT